MSMQAQTQETQAENPEFQNQVAKEVKNELLETLQYKKKIQQCDHLQKVGRLFQTVENIPMALKQYDKAIIIRGDLKNWKNDEDLGLLLINTGAIHKDFNIKKAKEYYQKATIIFSKVFAENDFRFGCLYYNLSATYQTMQMLTQCLEASKKAIKIFQQHEEAIPLMPFAKKIQKECLQKLQNKKEVKTEEK